MKRSWQFATIVFVSAIIVTLLLQSQTTRRLEHALRELHQQADSPSQTEAVGNVGPEAHVMPPMVTQAKNVAELDALRTEAFSLKKKLEDRNVFLSSLTENEALWQKLGGEKFEIEMAVGAPFAERKYYAKKLWTDVGDSSPAAALQTALWAAQSGNVARFIEVKKLTDVPPERRSFVIERLYRNGLGAIAVPADTAVGIKINSQEGNAQKMDFSVIFDLGPGRPPVPMRYSLENVDSAWKLDRIMMSAGESEEYVVPRY